VWFVWGFVVGFWGGGGGGWFCGGGGWGGGGGGCFLFFCCFWGGGFLGFWLWGGGGGGGLGGGGGGGFWWFVLGGFVFFWGFLLVLFVWGWGGGGCGVGGLWGCFCVFFGRRGGFFVVVFGGGGGGVWRGVCFWVRGLCGFFRGLTTKRVVGVFLGGVVCSGLVFLGVFLGVLVFVVFCVWGGRGFWGGFGVDTTMLGKDRAAESAESFTEAEESPGTRVKKNVEKRGKGSHRDKKRRRKREGAPWSARETSSFTRPPALKDPSFQWMSALSGRG